MAVRSFLHYALEVPDQTVGQKYYQDFGLVDASGGGQAVGLKPACQTREAVLLYAGPRKRLHHLCYGAAGEDFAQTRTALASAGVKEIDPPRGAREGGIWVRDPDGNLVNIRDPWGSLAEYYYDLDYIRESCAWEPRDWPEKDALYVWGPAVPPDFGENKEAST